MRSTAHRTILTIIKHEQEQSIIPWCWISNTPVMFPCALQIPKHAVVGITPLAWKAGRLLSQPSPHHCWSQVRGSLTFLSDERNHYTGRSLWVPSSGIGKQLCLDNSIVIKCCRIWLSVWNCCWIFRKFGNSLRKPVDPVQRQKNHSSSRLDKLWASLSVCPLS